MTALSNAWSSPEYMGDNRDVSTDLEQNGHAERFVDKSAILSLPQPEQRTIPNLISRIP